MQALRALGKAEMSAVPDKGKAWTKQNAVLEKDKRFLKESALTDLVELVRSAVRDGLKPDRFDLTITRGCTEVSRDRARTTAGIRPGLRKRGEPGRDAGSVETRPI